MPITRLLLIGAAVALVLGGVGVVISGGTGGPEMRAGALRIEPTAVRFGDTDTVTLTLTNVGSLATRFEASADVAWLAIEPSAAVVPGDDTFTVVVRASRFGAPPGDQQASLRISTVDGSAVVPITFAGGGDVASGPARLEVPDRITIPATATETTVTLTNAGAESLRWTATTDAPWLSASPAEGAIGGGVSRSVRVAVDRADLTPGTATGGLAITSTGGNSVIAVEASVTAIPLLNVDAPVLDFGSATGGERVRELLVGNAGLSTLRYQVSTSETWVRIDAGASGTIDPGGETAVRVRFDFENAIPGPSEVPLKITSDGGDASVAVRGVSDTVAPYARDRAMSKAHVHGERLFRHVTAEVLDDSRITDVQVRFQVCEGAPQSDVTCDGWRFVEMRPRGDDRWFADAGPLPACIPGRTQYIPWQIYTEDEHGHVRLLPGTKTPEIRPHCRNTGELA